MKVTFLLILLLGLQVPVYGESIMAPGEVVPGLKGMVFSLDPAGPGLSAGATDGLGERERLGDVVNYILSSVRCEVLREIDGAGERAIRISI